MAAKSPRERPYRFSGTDNAATVRGLFRAVLAAEGYIDSRGNSRLAADAVAEWPIGLYDEMGRPLPFLYNGRLVLPYGTPARWTYRARRDVETFLRRSAGYAEEGDARGRSYKTRRG